MAHLIDKLLALIIFVVVATALWHFYPYRETREKKDDRKAALPEIQPPVQQQMETAPVSASMEREEIAASPLFVRHLSDKATLLVRHRAARNACTGQLIVWSGAKRKGISDSYYDLGVSELGERPGMVISDETLDEFLTAAKEQLDELSVQSKRKRKAGKAAKQEVVVAAAEVVAAPVDTATVMARQSAEALPVVVEDAPPESIKLRKFPSVYRGVIKEVGMMKQCKDGREFDTFGVRYETQEGIVEAVFGANLRVALREAKADVGDQVEILKIGRKTIDKGKAPMNLFKVAKL